MASPIIQKYVAAWPHTGLYWNYMIPTDGVPWQPPPLDELLEEPFQRIERQQESYLLGRLEEMTRQLEEMEQELDTMVLEFARCS